LSKELVPSTNNLSGSFSKQPTEKNIVRSVNIEEPFKKEMVFEDNQLSSISENKNIETIQSPNSIIEVSSDKSSVEEESTNDGFIITSVKQTAETDNTILSEGDQPNQYVEGTNTWTGTVSEAEEQFTTNTVNGIDIVKDVNSQVPFTGKMQILNKNGSILGEVNLLDGKLHGEEIILDDTGIIVERYLWNKGVELK
jgi:antitoxin component YwqK of YwqJK toxin-antitoxin module